MDQESHEKLLSGIISLGWFTIGTVKREILEKEWMAKEAERLVCVFQ